MSDEAIRSIERRIAEGDDSGTTREALVRAKVRAGALRAPRCFVLHDHIYLGSTCSGCGRPDPRTKPGARSRNPRHLYGVRRFCERSERGDGECFEVFDRVTGATCSPALLRYQAEDGARARNQGGWAATFAKAGGL